MTYYLDGVGDGSDVPVASFKTTTPTGPLDNFDPGRDAFDGLVIAKGGGGVGESDPTKHQVWLTPAGGTTIDGSISLTLWSAMKTFQTNAVGNVTAFLVDFDAGGGSASLIASAGISRPDWDIADSGTWIEDTFDFGTVNYTFGAGRYLGVKIIVESSGGGDDMWFAYDAATYPARLNIGNKAPVLDLDMDDSSGAAGANFVATFTEDSGPVGIADADASLSDADSANLSSLTATITNLLDGASEVLAASTGGTSITASYNSSTGVLTLS